MGVDLTIPLDTVEDFKKFIKDNKIKSRKELRKFSTHAYVRFLKFSKEEQLLILKKKHDFTYMKFDDFRKFIKDNSIKSRLDFSTRFDGVFRKFCKLSEEEKEELLPLLRNYYSSLNTKEDFLKFIKENDIKSRTDFQIRFSSAYRKFNDLIPKEDRDKIEFENNINDVYYNHSQGEVFLMNLFNENNIKYITEMTFPDLKNTNFLRFDFYLPEYNILIEYQGSQHFDTNNKYYSENILFNDKKKYFYCKCTNKILLYFTLEGSRYRRLGYFANIITDPEILINKIKEIGMTNQPQ